MRGLQKSKRLSWASDLNLCQVKLFLSDESPSQVGLGGQDHLQAKESWHSDDNLPPGFEGIQPANLFQNKLSQITLIQWKCPSRFVVDPNWQVTAGEESKEVDLESQREMRVLEAVYPRPSAIPPNPASPIQDESYNDHLTPLIPVTPIEDDDTSSVPTTNGMPPPGIEPDVMNAAYTALTTAMSSSQGNLIDPNLLIKILSTPTLIEKLVSTHGPPSAAMLPPVTAAHVPSSTPSSSTAPHYARLGGPVHVHVPPPPPPPPLPPVEVNIPAKKDISYYKSLIQQHGGEKGEEMNNGLKSRDAKGKILKPCIYYNSARGCRHGANCVYQHDSSSQQRVSSLPESQTAKRMKIDREITGT
ncbi:hypothetical protein LXL04_022351 [Taraxacum kok-saghyz]